MLTESIATKPSTEPEDVDFKALCHESNGEDDVIFLRESKVPPNKYEKRAIDGMEISILQNGGMLTDVSINHAQMILHQQFPEVGGLEDTVLSWQIENLCRFYTMALSTGSVFQI